MTKIDKKTKQELFNYAVEQFNKEYYLAYEELKYNENIRLERSIINYHFDRVKDSLRTLGHTRIVDMETIREVWSKLLTERYIDGESPVVALYAEVVKFISTSQLVGE